MSERYVATVVKVLDKDTIVVNKGGIDGIKVGDKFIIIGIGDVITDPETNEELEKLEIVKGKVEATHVQEKITTLKSCLFKKSPDKKEIKKVSMSNKNVFGLFGPEATETEFITPGESILVELNGVKSGDVLIKA